MKDDLHWMFVGMRGLSLGELECGDTERPDIRLGVVSGLPRDYLWGLRNASENALIRNAKTHHPERRPDKRKPPTHGIAQLTRDAEIRKLDIPLLADEYIGSLDIPMNLADRVKVFKTEQHLAHRDGDLRLREWSGFQLFLDQRRTQRLK